MSALTSAVREAQIERRKVRDTERDAFFGDLGVNRISDPFSYELDPLAQLSVCKYLLEQSQSMVDGDSSGIEMALQSLMGLNVGVSHFTTTSAGRPDLSMLDPKTWETHHFSNILHTVMRRA